VAVKFFEVENLGTVRVAKHSNSRSLRLSITPNGEIRVTIPTWTPYASGVDFARSKAGWITLHRPKQSRPMGHGYRIGKAHVLKFDSAAIDKPTARIAASEIRITRPNGMAISHSEVQSATRRAAIRALRSQAEALLPKRLKQLSDMYGFSYGSVTVKQLKGRWGSCDNKKDIVLNLFLMQLPWELIDYVLIHELVHTKHLNHSADFWAEFARHEPRCKSLRTRVRSHQPILTALPPQSG
jgi:predicted metal-dependent hydrolase